MSTINTSNLHPEDVLFFADVAAACRRVAQNYGLPLKSISPLPDAHLDLDTDRWGDCDGQNIRLMLRPKLAARGPLSGDQSRAPQIEPRGSSPTELVWADSPLSPAEVWRTAAHELAHLRHLNHSSEHDELTGELEQALQNQQETHREKVLRKLVKMQAQAQSEAKIGNQAAAEAFAEAINRMLIEYELNPSDIDYARAQDNDPIIELLVDLPKYGMPVRKARSAWQESLAHVVAEAHLCRFLIRKASNAIWFVGTKSHVTVAEYSYGTLVAAAEQIADQEWTRYGRIQARNGTPELVRGFRQSWLAAFVARIRERLEAQRQEAIAAHDARLAAQGESPAHTGTAVLRLNTALVKVKQYMDDKFSGKRGRLNAVHTHGTYHAEGRAWAPRHQ